MTRGSPTSSLCPIGACVALREHWHLVMMGATPVPYYLVETLRASPATVNTYAALTLPWCLKFFYGLQTDLISFAGGPSTVILLFRMADLCHMQPLVGNTRHAGLHGNITSVFGYTAGFMLAVVADALILECSQVGENSQNKGRMPARVLREGGGHASGLAGSCLFNGPTCADSDAGPGGWN